MPGIEKTMHEFKHGTLHSGSKHGPKVKSREQAIAIALNQERKHNSSPMEERAPADDLVCLGDQLRPFQGYDQDPPDNESDLFSFEAGDTIERLKPAPRRQIT